MIKSYRLYEMRKKRFEIATTILIKKERLLVLRAMSGYKSCMTKTSRRNFRENIFLRDTIIEIKGINMGGDECTR